MITALIVDDNNQHRQDLDNLLKSYPEIKVVAQCESGFEGIEAIALHKPQLVFLDVDMPGMSGFEMLEQIEQRNFDTIFTTAHSQYAINAFEIACLDYITKPLHPERFQQAIEKFYTEQGNRDRLKHYEVLLNNQKAINYENKTLVLPDNHQGHQFFLFDSIVFCSSAGEEGAAGAYTIFHFKNRESRTATNTLKYYEGLLTPHGFDRTHKGYLVNLKYIKSYNEKNGAEITLEHYPDKKIPISRRRQPVFKSKFS